MLTVTQHSPINEGSIISKRRREARCAYAEKSPTTKRYVGILGFEPRTSASETDVLTVTRISQFNFVGPPGYDPGSYPYQG